MPISKKTPRATSPPIDLIHDWQELRDRLRRMIAMAARHEMLFTEVRTVIYHRSVSADGVLRSKQAISLLQHSQSDH